MLKIWSRRVTADMIEWFKLTNELAYENRDNRTVMKAILNAQGLVGFIKGIF